MKSEHEIKRQLEEVYNHRLQLRMERKTKPMCRNCRFGICREFDLGDFGTMTKWECKDGRSCGAGCGVECGSTAQEIEDEVFADISDPAICGAKEPKIAMLLWVLHNSRKNESTGNSSSSSSVSLWERIKKVFSD